MRPGALQATGIVLFAFIPLVLFLFVRHPEPLVASLVAGVALMLGHRFVARPYMERVRERKCIWCNRVLATEAPRRQIGVLATDREVSFVACPGHEVPAGRFFAWADRLRLPLRLGIGLPLVALLVALALAASGNARWAPRVTDLFRLVVGLTVNVAALGPTLGTVAGTPRAAFPLHNFTLLGLRATLWIFRLVGIWWIVSAVRTLAGGI
jgi:hypothetical protein